MKTHQEFVIQSAHAGLFLEQVIHELLAISWSKARDLINSGKIRIAERTIVDCKWVAKTGDIVHINMNAPRAQDENKRPLAEVVYVDEHVVVANKPSGLNTIPFEKTEHDTLIDRVQHYLLRHDKTSKAFKQAKRGGRPDLGIVHRIDKETSGLVVFTRTLTAKKSLSEQFRHHTVLRHYFAIAHGTVESKTIRSYLLEDRGDGIRGSNLTALVKGGILAVTHVEFKQQLKNASLVVCRLETGRTHQIRIHLSEQGHPIVGEKVYIRDYKNSLIFAPRLMLHAAMLGFVHPVSQKIIQFEQPLPIDMQKIIATLNN